MKKRNQIKLLIMLSVALLANICNAPAQITFQKDYNGSSIDKQEVFSVAQNKNSPDDYYFSGAQSTVMYRQGTVTKTNYKGEWQWSKESSNAGGFCDIKCTYDNSGTHTGTIACGNQNYSNYVGATGYGFRLLRTNPAGNMVQYQDYDYNSFGTAYKVEQATTLSGDIDGFITVGFRPDNGQDKIYLVRTDETLTAIWSKVFSLSGIHCRGFSVKQTDDKGFILTGYAGTDLFVIKTDAAGAISWQKLYTIPGVSATGNDILEVINTSSNPEYFVLAHTSGSVSDIAMLHLDQSGAVLKSIYFSLPGTDYAKGMVYLSSGHITFSGNNGNVPVLIKTNTALNAISFAKQYTNAVSGSAPILTNDNGYMVGGMLSNSDRYYLIKTDTIGVSDCHEMDIYPGITPINLMGTANASFSPSPGIPQTNVTNFTSFTVTENVICKDFCKGINYATSNVDEHACYGESKSLNANCPPGSTTKWFKEPDMVTVLGTGASFAPNTTTGNAVYVSRCYNANDCIVDEVRHHLTVSPAPYGTYELIEACYGQYLTLSNPCGVGQIYQWTNPPGASTPSINLDALSNQMYTVDCIDAYGCVIRTHTFDVQVVSYPYVQTYSASICEGASYDLNNAIPGFSGCTWSILPNHTPITGSIVSPTTTTSYYAECRDAQGCYTYHAVEVNVTPAPVSSLATTICEGNTLNLNSFAGSGCSWSWIDVNTGLSVPGTGLVPALGSHLYRGSCYDINGCVSYYDLAVDVIPWNVITQTVYATCGVPFNFAQYSELCDYGISSWASLAGNNYVMFPVGWAPSSNITIYGFGTNVLGYCCRVEMEVIVTPAPPTLHELCYNGSPYTIPFTCKPGNTIQWTKNGIVQPNGYVNSPGTYVVTCTNSSGCIERHAIFTIVEDPNCDMDIDCYYEGYNIQTGGCPMGSTSAQYEKNGVPYTSFTVPTPPTTSFLAPTNGPGTYTLTCRDAQGNITARKYYHLCACNGSYDKPGRSTAITSYKNEEPSIDVYPNPGSGIFNLSVKMPQSADYVVKVSDMLGKEVIRNQSGNSAKDIMLNLAGQAPGVYYVQVVVNNSVYTSKIVLQ